MAQAWLNPTDYRELIPDIPQPFRFEKLDAFEREQVSMWLRDLITREQLTTYSGWFDDEAYAGAFEDGFDAAIWPTSFPGVGDREYRAGRAMRVFLVYAVWSRFVLRSNAQLTDTGYVTKLNPDSDPIDKATRVEMSVTYRTLAERAAADMLSILAESTTTCNATIYPGLPTVRKAQRRSPSRLGN